jgi:hypothetical protein
MLTYAEHIGYLSGFISSATTPVAGLAIMIAEMLLAKLPEKVSIRQHTSAYVSIRIMIAEMLLAKLPEKVAPPSRSRPHTRVA